MVVDGFPQEQLVKYYDQYGPRGFKLWLDKGAWYGNNHYSHATTYTGVGHATLLSCAHPYKHGVVGNDWIDKATGKRLYSTEDARYKYLDEPTAQHAGTSPFNMKVTTVGDELLYANGKSKVIAIAGKDRSSIGLAGQSGTAYMHSTATGRFITSEYYMSDYPAWWKSFYANKPQNKYFGQTWTPLLPEEAYARSAPDNRPSPGTKSGGDIVVMNKPNWYLFAKPTTYASTHGSPWAYDTNVPLAMYGPNWINPGKYGDFGSRRSRAHDRVHPQRSAAERL